MKKRVVAIRGGNSGQVRVYADNNSSDYGLTLPPSLPTQDSVLVVQPSGTTRLDSQNNSARVALPFLNGWTNLDIGFWGAASVIKINGVVHLFGVIQGGTLATGVALFQLPAAMRPHANLLLTSRCAANGTVRLDVYTTGMCVFGGEFSGSPTAWTSISGLCFPTY